MAELPHAVPRAHEVERLGLASGGVRLRLVRYQVRLKWYLIHGMQDNLEGVPSNTLLVIKLHTYFHVC